MPVRTRIRVKTFTVAIVVTLAAVGAVVATSVSTGHAAGVTTGTISGTITQASDGSAASNVCALIYQASSTSEPVNSGCSDATGHYAVSGIEPGQYLVQFVDGDTTRHDIPQWYQNQPNSTTGNFVVVQSGNTTANINAVMGAGGWITGTITDAGTGNPISNECVNVYDMTGLQSGAIYSDGSLNYEACTDADGKYITGGLAAGDYQVAFNTSYFGGVLDSNYTSQWYNDQVTQENANPVAVVTGAPSTSINADLQPAATTVSVSGTVSDASGLVSFAAVYFYDTSGYVAGTSTASDGTYTAFVPPGIYQVEFQPPSGSSDQSQWYNDMPTQATADSLTVVAGTPVRGINAVLSSGGTITGTVTDGAGDGLPAIDVEACSTLGYSCAYGESGTGGVYSLTGLSTGSYSVTFMGDQYGYDPSTGMQVDTSAYLDQIYPNTIEGAGSGTPVSVTAGLTTSGIDDTAVLGSTFSGTITDAETGAPLSNVCVSAEPTGSTNYYEGYTCTDTAGTYTTSGVPTGTYQLDFTNPYGRYIEQWYDNVPDQASAAVVQVTQPTAQTGIDAAMQLGGNITGTVTASDGSAPLSNICVELYPVGAPSGTPGLTGGCTNSAGQYSSPAVPSGSYDVEFVDNSGIYASQYYNDASGLATATAVTVTQGQTTSDIDAALSEQTVPGAPTNVVATAADAAATVTFSAPVSDGGSAITGYTITPSPACASCTGLTTASASTTVSGLTNGTAYTFTVAATNLTGTGPASTPSNSVTPSPSTGTPNPPGAPTNVSATVDVSTVALSFSAPASDGGSPITGYTITPSPPCASCTGLTTAGTSTQVNGLTVGTAYSFTVSAANVVGPSKQSVLSNAVTPTAQAVSPVSASTTSPSTPAVVTNNGTTATASGGTGTVTVSEYPTDPAGPPPYPSTGAYLDVSDSTGSTFSSVVIKDCNLNGGTSLEWWNPEGNPPIGPPGAGAWQSVIGDPTDTSGLPGCLSETLDATSSPTLSQLDGTIFGVAAPSVAQPTALTTSLSGSGKNTGSTISVREGTRVTDSAALSGTNVATAGGTVTYRVYAKSTCSGMAAPASRVRVNGGVVPPSNPETLAPGTYFWQATYSGNSTNGASISPCGSEVEKVLPSPPPPHSCSGTFANPGVLAGTYTGNTTITGYCIVDGGPAIVTGDLILAKGAALNATYALNDVAGSGTSSLRVTGDVEVSKGATLDMGCEPNHAPCTDSTTLTGSDQVGGALSGRSALGIIVHASTIKGSVSQTKGGGGANCNPPTTGFFSVIGSPVFSDYEDNNIVGSLQVSGLQSCWFGALRNRVHQNVSYYHNLLAGPYASEVVSNVVLRDMSCVGNSPAVQFGDSAGRPNKVGVHATGQCSFATYQPNPAPSGPLLPISVPRSIK